MCIRQSCQIFRPRRTKHSRSYPPEMPFPALRLPTHQGEEPTNTSSITLSTLARTQPGFRSRRCGSIPHFLKCLNRQYLNLLILNWATVEGGECHCGGSYRNSFGLIVAWERTSDFNCGIRAQWTLFQYGNISSSYQSPGFFCPALRVRIISFLERASIRSPGFRLTTSDGVFFAASPRIIGYCR